MPDQKPYVPLSERLNQDVVHDNIIPKYSALATVQPSRLILIGVWLIFGSMALGMPAIALSMVVDASDALTAIVSSLLPALFFVLAITVLVTQTRRYNRHRRSSRS
jgi:hypothetical protein